MGRDSPAFNVMWVIVWFFILIVCPIWVAHGIGERKGRRGWLYPILFCVFGTWAGVIVIYLMPAKKGFRTEKPLKIRPSPDKAVFREDRPKAPAYVPPKRCPDCRGLVPHESPVCGRCGHSFSHALSTT
jgi:hypothetical protein